MRLPLPACLKRFARCQDGATALEFAMISPVLFILVMGVLELSMVLTAQTLLESATYTASRTGKTQFIEQGKTQGETIRGEINRIGKLLMDPERITVTRLSYEDFGKVGEPESFVDANSNGMRDNGESFTDANGNGQYDQDQGAANFGRSGEIVVYETTYDWKLFTPMISKLLGEDGIVQISARAVVKNEPTT